MNSARANPDDYIQFLLATPKVCSATEAERVQPERPGAPCHDAFTRLLHRLEPESQTLWQEVRPHPTRERVPRPRRWRSGTRRLDARQAARAAHGVGGLPQVR